MAETVKPFPWSALERLSRTEVVETARARRWLGRSLDLARLSETAVALLGVPVELQLRGVRLESAAPAGAGVMIALAAEGAGAFTLELEHALAARLAARVVGRHVPWVDPTRAVPPELAGAAAAFALVLARRAGEAPWRLVGTAVEGAVLVASFVVLLGDEVFSASATVAVLALDPPAPRFDAAALARLGDVPISLPLVAATSLATGGELAALVPGAAWAPGAGWTLARRPDGEWSGHACLLAPRSESGLPVQVDGRSHDGRIVLTPGASTQPWEDHPVTDKTADIHATPETLADADVVVRVEIATVTLPARAWAAVSVGDVIATGVRLGEAVTLRAGGAAFARGELCDVDGELAVRVLERAGAPA